MFSEEILGYYTSVYCLNLIMPLLANSIWQIFIPRFTAEYENNNVKRIRKESFFACLICIGVTALALLVCLFFGNFLLRIIFGKAISEYGYLLMPTIAVSGISLISGLFSALLTAKKRYYAIGLSGIVPLAVCVFFTDNFLEKFGLLGGIYVVIIGSIGQIVFSYLLLTLKRTQGGLVKLK
jgi:O-antigen/teichoic acid export membrane protein